MAPLLPGRPGPAAAQPHLPARRPDRSARGVPDRPRLADARPERIRAGRADRAERALAGPGWTGRSVHALPGALSRSAGASSGAGLHLTDAGHRPGARAGFAVGAGLARSSVLVSPRFAE